MPVSAIGNYLELKCIIDDISEQMMVNVQNDSDTSRFNSTEENGGKKEVLDEESVEQKFFKMFLSHWRQ
jgi:hypothetical protein